MKKIKRVLMALISGALIAASLTACSQSGDQGGSTSDDSADGTLTVGVIQYASHPSLDNCYQGLIEGLEEKGFQQGENLTIDFQNANGSSESSDLIAKNMAAKSYDVIVGIATPSAISAFSATRGTDVTPVFCAVSDPVAAGLVTSLEDTSDGCTGTSDLLNLEAQLKLIHACQPDAKKIGILYTTSEANSVSHLIELQQLASTYGFEIEAQGVQNGADIPQAAAALVTKVDCINNFTDNNVVDNLTVVLEQANSAGIPVYGSEIEQVKNGCLASESLDYVALGRETGYIVANVLGGQSASEIPVAMVKDSFPVINTDVMETFGITLPAGYENIEQVTTNQE